jgi:hypothetical protein
MIIDDAYEAKHKGLVLGQAVDLWMVVPPVDSPGRLFRVPFFACGPRPQPRLQALCEECTGGYYSQAAARKNGFQERERLAYRHFRF